MKASDIKVGEFYAYADWEGMYSQGSAKKVKVVETGVQVKSGYWAGSKTVKGTLVELEDGRTLGVHNRTIREPWEPYKAYHDAQRRARRELARSRTQKKIDRANQARLLADLLAAFGEPVETTNLYDEESAVEAAQRGFLVVMDEQFGARYLLVAPQAHALLKFWERGDYDGTVDLPADLLLRLLEVATEGIDDPDRTTDLEGNDL